MKNVLVTGGMGFIGSNFIRYALTNEENINIINVDKLTYAGNPENLKNFTEQYLNRYTFYKADICDYFSIEKIMEKEDVNYIINFAAESHVDRSIENPKIFCDTNIVGTQTLLNLSKAKGIKKYLQVSTDEVYGSLDFDDPAFTENTPLNPNSPYSASKASADLLARSYFKTYGLPVNISRCSNNYGPYQFPEKLIPLMINNVLNDEQLPIYGKGINVRDWIYVEDHCDALLKVLWEAGDGEIYNIGGDSEISNINLVKKLLKLLDKPESLIRLVKDRPGHDLRYAIDHTKITKDLNWHPKTELETGLKKTVDWYLTHQDWLEHVITKEYLTYYQKQYGQR
ncbi:MAG: dTDP-glucose 4,6-dehydratase [Candidatus Lokiarchaeota archaeon]|nr:dTDP-glucose 4,6-dehydratase [Candidatus Lokiarchaeota archaeon]